jgi:hypothetical protein
MQENEVRSSDIEEPCVKHDAAAGVHAGKARCGWSAA